jgi:hypothetical protein
MLENETNRPLSRRQILRVTGTAAFTAGALTLGLASPAQAAQSGWVWCAQCEGLWFSGNPSDGSCPFLGTGQQTAPPHTTIGSGDYTIKFTGDGGNGQDGWYWCVNCQGMFFNPYGDTVEIGLCPAFTRYSGLGHRRLWGSYRIEQLPNLDGGPRQTGWRWCSRCAGLWFIGNKSSGRCWGNDVGHTSGNSGNYALRVAPR